MSSLAWTLVTSSLTAAVVTTVVTTIWDYFRIRRSELLHAYSEWIEALSAAVNRGLIYFDVVKSFAPLYVKQEQDIGNLKRAIASGQPGQELLRALEDRVMRDMQFLTDANAAASEAEHRLGVAMNLVNIVESRFQFRKRVLDLSRFAFRGIPPDATPATLVGLATVYQSNVDPVTKTGAPALIKEVISTHLFRGFWDQEGDPG